MRAQPEKALIIDVDSVARAVYVRLSDKPVARTEPITTKGTIVTVDLDAKGDAVGVEVIGYGLLSVRSASAS